MADTGLRSPFIPNTTEDRAAMLAAVGAKSVEELFADIPAEHRHPHLALPEALDEMALRREMEALAARNLAPGASASFLGAGVYHHFCPAAVAPLVTRGEFLTSYTPYQPEVSQGTLQGSYEFQTLTAQLFGMEVSNAGMYDGASALAEAALMACRITGHARVAVTGTVNPRYVETVRAYSAPQGIEVYTVDASAPALEPETAALLAQYPNYLGVIEDAQTQSDAAHAAGALFCLSADPVAQALFKPAGDFGADIATGEGQALGVPPSYGGPYVGIFTCKREHIRQLPGRIVGRTTDAQGRTGYVLTLQPREQHIRRQHATSNICTSTALVGLWATIYMALMGKQGLRRVAELCYQKAHYAAARIGELPGYFLPVEGTFFQEFVVSCPAAPERVNRTLEASGIVGGMDVSDRVPHGMLVCVNETHTKADIDLLVDALKGVF
ncbi:MAG: aminomethyl-transferring glycine dehydrogenase subunit GcvPA [Chloroflexota bacterium]